MRWYADIRKETARRKGLYYVATENRVNRFEEDIFKQGRQMMKIKFNFLHHLPTK